MVCTAGFLLESLGLEVMMVLAGMLPNSTPAQAGMTVAIEAYMFPYTIQAAISEVRPVLTVIVWIFRSMYVLVMVSQSESHRVKGTPSYTVLTAAGMLFADGKCSWTEYDCWWVHVGRWLQHPVIAVLTY